MARISFADFAKMVGVSRSSITQAVQSGRLTAHEDEEGRRFLIDSDAMQDWVNNSSAEQKKNAVDIPDEKIEKISDSQSASAFPKLNDSRAIREAFKARIEKIKYEEMLGKLVDIEKAQNEYFEIARKVRDSLMAIPDRISAQVAAETNQFKVHKIIMDELRIALRNLKEENA